MPDPILTPHELHLKAISILDQLERIGHDWRRGRMPDADEIDVVTAAVADLHAQVERTAAGVPEPGQRAVEDLTAARRCLADAQDLVRGLLGAPGPPPVVARRTVPGARPRPDDPDGS